MKVIKYKGQCSDEWANDIPSKYEINVFKNEHGYYIIDSVMWKIYLNDERLKYFEVIK